MKLAWPLAGLVLAIVATVLLSSCQALQFYGQAITGQISILNQRRPVREVMDDPASPEDLKEKLALVLEICEFAQNDLFLPAGGNFRNYIDLGRPYVVWSVFAAPELSLTPRKWCYPIVGCMTYQGYFSKESARDYGRRLARQGYDVYVGGVSAYSTLGWFDDPVLNTFITRSEADLAALIFHELAHGLLYIPGDTPFNEAFANTAAAEGVERWLLRKNDDRALDRFRIKESRRSLIVQLIAKYKAALQTLYGRSIKDEVKRERKKMILEGLKSEYRQLVLDWDEHKGYDHWFEHELNNAKLVSVATYHDFVPAFQALLTQNREI